MRELKLGVIGVAFALVFAANGIANEQPASVEPRKPTFSNSISWNVEAWQAGKLPTSGGPLFERFKKEFQRPVFNPKAIFAPNAENKFQRYVNVPSLYRPFDEKAASVVKRNCFGPFFLDEGVNWTQLSWVCNPSPDTPLSEYVRFKTTPELSVTLRFESGLISSFHAMEPYTDVPGIRRLPPEAYDALKARKQ